MKTTAEIIAEAKARTDAMANDLTESRRPWIAIERADRRNAHDTPLTPELDAIRSRLTK